jgi:ISXO2-like transposase domain
MAGPHLVSSLLKRWTAGTLHYRLSYQHMPYYLDEFTFRFNRRKLRRPRSSCTGSGSKGSRPPLIPEGSERQLHSSRDAGHVSSVAVTTDKHKAQ